MDLAVATKLLEDLNRVIAAMDGSTSGHPAGRLARRRAQAVAEKVAIRRLMRSGSPLVALNAGTEAYAREMRYFSPLTFVHDGDESQESNVVSMER